MSVSSALVAEVTDYDACAAQSPTRKHPGQDRIQFSAAIRLQRRRTKT